MKLARWPAGGDASVRNCYLKNNLEMDPNPAATEYNWQPNMPVYPPNPDVRYTGGVPIMFESGTKTKVYPDMVYGCPYPPSADGSCTVCHPINLQQCTASRSPQIAIWTLTAHK